MRLVDASRFCLCKTFCLISFRLASAQHGPSLALPATLRSRYIALEQARITVDLGSSHQTKLPISSGKSPVTEGAHYELLSWDAKREP